MAITRNAARCTAQANLASSRAAQNNHHGQVAPTRPVHGNISSPPERPPRVKIVGNWANYKNGTGIPPPRIKVVGPWADYQKTGIIPRETPPPRIVLAKHHLQERQQQQQGAASSPQKANLAETHAQERNPGDRQPHSSPLAGSEH